MLKKAMIAVKYGNDAQQKIMGFSAKGMLEEGK